jgi:LPS export ABC transporter protein LptC
MINLLLNRGVRLSSLLATFILLLTLYSCENDLSFIQNLSKSNESVDVVKEVNSYFSQAGKIKANLRAPIMLRYQDTIPRIEFPQKLHVDFFGDNRIIQSYLDAKKGSYYENQGKVLLEDSVIVIRNDGDTLKTNKLIWEQSKHIFFTDEDVEIRQKTKTIFGKGFESDEQLKNFSIDTVTGIMLVESGKLSSP